MTNRMTDQYPSDSKQCAGGRTVRGFIHNVDTGKLEEVGYAGPMGSIG